MTAEDHRWVASPQPGVERVMLDRIGAERARATSLVRYQPNSIFPTHGHPGGEEILVLSGTFSDDSGDYGPGWYLRNPPGSSHQPSSLDGALIFVKLWQMAAGESTTVRANTRDSALWHRAGDKEVCPLYESSHEQVSLQRFPSGAPVRVDTQGGAELLVLDGQLSEGHERFARGSWMRLPPGHSCALTAGAAGVTIYLKTGHLAVLIA
ncbi:MAG: cupin domain-containing protein [Aquabacterium sp.]|nr:cupin domain-containing protein [Aquabacterium sp.]MDX9843270.1 cupin domain-containing protein [Aquabacterium sp.]